MIDLSDCIAIGTIIKAHGVRGQVVLRLNQFEFDDIHSLEPVFIEIDGLPVPFFIADYAEKDPHHIIVSFEYSDTETNMLEIINSKVYVPVKNIRKKALITDNFEVMLGFEVRDSVLGKLGILTEIISNNNNPLFRVNDKKKEILIPIQPAFILEIDKTKKIIHVQTPDGLTDLD